MNGMKSICMGRLPHGIRKPGDRRTSLLQGFHSASYGEVIQCRQSAGAVKESGPGTSCPRVSIMTAFRFGTADQSVERRADGPQARPDRRNGGGNAQAG